MRAIALVVALLAALPATAQAGGELPLGHPGLDEARTTDVLARGVTYTRIERGRALRDRRAGPSTSPWWRTDPRPRISPDVCGRRASSPSSPRSRSRPTTARTVRSGTECAPGGLRQESDADARAAAHPRRRAAGPRRGVHRGGRRADERPVGRACPFLERVDLRRGPIRYWPTTSSSTASGCPSSRPRHGAIAAINGGYFVIGEADGTPGDLAGSSILERAARLGGRRRTDRPAAAAAAHAAAQRAVGHVAGSRAADGAQRLLDGENRRPGLIRACGGERR